ncbi:MAG: TonB-dependent receptor [Clostridium sp.]|nr:TonB-dependent receptor [Clostridium sp.]
MGQQDTVVTTMLNEVAIVGEKQNASSEMSAVTTISQSMLQRENVRSMRGIGEIAPNFFLPAYGSRMTSSIYVRGLGARIDQPAVGLSVDGVPFLNKNNYDFDILDIGKIEVFRGAQSILNGRNTMCGQVNISTLSPWAYQGLKLMAEYGRANSAKAAISYYARVNDKLATSITGYYAMTDGYFRNEYNHGRLDTDKSGSLRWKLSWHPSSRLSVTNAASAGITRQGGYPYEDYATGKLAYNDTCFYRRFSFADGLTVGWSSKRVVVTSVTSVQYIDDNMTLDQDFTPEPYFTLTQKSKEWALTEDLYARGRRGKYNWLAGVFGFYKHNDMNAPVTFKDTGISKLIEAHPNQMNPSYPISWDTRQFVLGSAFLNIAKGVALYQQSKYQLGAWDFEFGLRWDLEWASLMYNSDCSTGYTTWHVLPDGTKEVYGHSPVDIHDHGHLSQNFGELLPKLAVGYDFGNARVYANVSKAYKAGGYNSQMFSDVLQQRIMELMGLTMKYDVDEIVSYKPEKSWNYELGVKGTAGRLDYSGTLFYISCTDQQLTTFPDGMTTGRIMTNAGRTRSYGAEATVTWSPTDQLQLYGSYGYTNATFRRYFNGKEDFRGKRLPYAPSNTLFASVNYSLPRTILGVVPSVCASVRGVGDIYWDEANTVRQPFYATLSASLALDHEKWSVRLWAENITNTKYNTFYFVSIGHAFVQRAAPWSAGATLRINI